MSEDQCLTANWYDMGSKDAYRGLASSRLQSHAEACGEFGVSPNGDAYKKGYAQGQTLFCTAERGLEYGRDGSSYRRTCPVALESIFNRGYRIGKDIYDAEAELTRIDNRIKAKEKELDKSEDDKERRKIRDEIDELDDDRRELRRDIDDLESDARRI